MFGALRHNGFIPWDDDIDVGTPREDYEKSDTLFKGAGMVKLIDCYNSNQYYLSYGKLCNYKVDLHENIKSKLHIGAYIDIFPFDYLEKKIARNLINSSILNHHLKYLGNIKN